MSYRIEAATKEEWAARCLNTEDRLAASQARIARLEAALVTAREDALREAASLCEGAGAFADEMAEPILQLITNEDKP
tara:strand:+ start:279 stop:512 length:234 start_codon:yes stop_codon:yes gene_type:complete